MIDLSELRQRTRRNFLLSAGAGLGSIALAQLLIAEEHAPPDPLAPKRPHFLARAKNAIFLFMEGAPSQLDLFDPKPALTKWAGMPLPASVTKELQLAFIKPTAQVFPSPRTFAAYGQCGTEFSDFIPQVASCADDLCLVRSMHTEAFNHHPGQALLMSGSIQLGRPTAGAWVTYGLGSESQELPGFVVLSSGRGTSAGSNNWSSGFLPSTHQGVVFRSSGDPILYLENPPGISRETQQARIGAINKLNAERYRETGDTAIAARIQSYELAFRMQMAAPKLLDFSDEKPATLEMYGVNREPTRPYATNCLLARRMVERGVRFVMLAHGTWDDHQEINKKLKKNCDITDQPVGALIKDLKQRGLLDSTLLVWGGEFGRTPMAEQQHSWEDAGRDHHPNCFSMWLAGGGIKGGQVIGKTDELGINGVEERVHIHDLHATMLHCLGMDHKKLTYRHMGRDFRLTDVSGRVVEKMIA
jgi:hypothetical protein